MLALSKVITRREVTVVGIKIGKKTVIRYTRPMEAEGEVENCTLNVVDGDVSPDLTIKLGQFKPLVIEAGGLDEVVWSELKVIGISFNREGRTIKGASISAKCDSGDENFSNLNMSVGIKQLSERWRQLAIAVSDEIEECIFGKRAEQAPAEDPNRKQLPFLEPPVDEEEEEEDDE